MDIEKIISDMTLHEKIDFCIGADMWHTKNIKRLGIGSVTMSDGPHGMRFQGDVKGIAGLNKSAPATCFPSAVTAAATWNEKLIYEQGRAIGREAHDLGVDIVLGPGCNIKRNPLGGRNFEYYSEDPLLSGKLAAAQIRGLQSETVSACLKHFAVNSQEYMRQTSDSVVDERALHEIYLSAFETAVKEAHPDSLMCSYNMINGVYASDNRQLLTDILRREWGFSGLVISDWGAVNDRIAAFEAGCDLCMPGGSSYMTEQVEKAVESGRLSEENINASVRRILRVYEKYVEHDNVRRAVFTEHHELAQKVAEEGAVLLKNDGVLPVKVDDICLIGHMCEETRYQGAGSSHINPHTQVNICDAFRDVPYVACCDEKGNVSDDGLRIAAELASSKRTAVVVAGLPEYYECEAKDREHMRLPDGHNRMIRAVAAANPNTVVVLLGGSPMELPWVEDVRAVLYMGLPGQAAGTALQRLLCGEICPSGKLAETWPICCDDVASVDTFGKRCVQYKESIFVGYRHYCSAGIQVRYPFGHGLSYTSFKYDNLCVDGNTVSVDITNTGSCRGAETVQIYISKPKDGLFCPDRELCGFAKIVLEPNETKTVKTELADRAFSVWSKGWRIQAGTYRIMVGSSCKDIRLSVETEKDGEHLYSSAGGFYVHPGREKPTQSEWEKLLDREVCEPKEKVKGSFDMNSTCMDMIGKTWVARPLRFLMKLVVGSRVSGKHDMSNPEYRMMFTSTVECPMRTLIISSCGAVKESFVNGLIEMANGHFLRGTAAMLGLKLRRNK